MKEDAAVGGLNQPTTTGKRFLKLAGMSASIAKKVVTKSAAGLFKTEEQKQALRKEMYTQIGQEMASTLGQMKGAAMKVGQILAQVKDFLPAEVSDALGDLREHSPPMPYALVSEQIQISLGDSPENLFKTFNKEPYRAASLGQVHRATLHSGREVVIKVQYPGVRDACESDLRQLNRLLRLAGVVKIEKSRLDAIFGEIQKLILRELDFKQEADHIRDFQAFHEQHDYILIPDVISDLSKESVITLSYESGESIIYLQEPENQTEENQELRNKISENIYRAFSEQIINFHQAHLDPHAGNFAYREDGTLVIFDFGAVAYFDEQVIDAFKTLIQAAFEEDVELLDRLLVERGLKKTQLPLGQDFYQPWIDILKSPYVEHGFDFGRSDLHQKIMGVVKSEWRTHLKNFSPMPDSLLLDRLIVGHYWNFVRLGAKMELLPILNEYISVVSGDARQSKPS